MSADDSGILQYLAHGGVFAWLAIVVALGLFVGGGLLVIIAHSRKLFIPFLIAALLPLAIGGAGKVVGDMLVDHVLETQGPLEPGEMERARRQTRIPLEIGAIATVPLLLLGIVGLLTKDRSSPTP